MTRPSTNHALRNALLEVLSTGRAVTTSELRTKITATEDFATVTAEAVYRHLDALARHGQIRRVRAKGPDRRHLYWTQSQADGLPDTARISDDSRT